VKEQESGNSSTALADGPNIPKHRRFIGVLRSSAPALTAVVLTLISLTIPRVPVTTDPESSWGAALNYAHEKGLQFGTQIVFTHGPLGFLTTPFFSTRRRRENSQRLRVVLPHYSRGQPRVVAAKARLALSLSCALHLVLSQY
jgi:hypothetical protein